MFSVQSNFLFATLFSIFVDVQSLVKLLPNEDIDIASAETAIRDTFNTLFTSLKIRDVKNKPRLKEFSTIHIFFVSITLKDYDNLQEIELLSQVDDVDNDTYFIAQINEVLDGDDNSEILAENTDVEVYVETFIKKLRYLKDNYNSHNNSSNLGINPDFFQYLSSSELSQNATNDSSNIESFDTNIIQYRRHLGQGGRRVYKGTSVYNIERFPFMASIHFFNKYRCGGSIITTDLIITSSSCLQLLVKNGDSLNSNPDFLSFVSVRVGSTYTSTDGETFGVYGIYFHPYFNPSTLENNIGLIKLKQHITFSKKIECVGLDSVGIPTDIDDRITVIGWGAKDSSYFKSRLLSYAKLDYYPLHYCKKVYSTNHVKDYHFCAGFKYKKGGACNYDIGGPGIVHGVLAGILNFGPVTCGKLNSPTVFTKVAYYSSWIKDIMGQDLKFSPITTKNGKSIISNIPESVDFNFARTDKPVAATKALQQHNDLIGLLNDFKDFVSMIFVSTAS